jgi:hypothetical protein
MTFRTGLRRDHVLNGLDGLLDLLIRKRLNSLRAPRPAANTWLAVSGESEHVAA